MPGYRRGCARLASEKGSLTPSAERAGSFLGASPQARIVLLALKILPIRSNSRLSYRRPPKKNRPCVPSGRYAECAGSSQPGIKIVKKQVSSKVFSGRRIWAACGRRIHPAARPAGTGRDRTVKLHASILWNDLPRLPFFYLHIFSVARILTPLDMT